MTFEHIWSELESDAPPSGMMVRRILSDGPRDIFLAIVNPGRHRQLIIALKTAQLSDGLKELKLEGVALKAGAPSYRPGEFNSSVTLELTSRSFSEVFDTLAQDVAAVASGVADEIDAVDATFARLDTWGRFLDRLRPEGLTAEEQRGLFGELWTLINVLAGPVGNSSVINAWTGPTGADQDFQHEGFAAEVKTTVQHEPQTIRIASERQLDLVGIDRFLLFHLSIDSRQGSGTTLPDVVDEVRSLSSSVGTRVNFEELLFQAGYSDIHRHLYDSTGFTIRDQITYSVTDDFPRIIESQIPDGVGDVHYSIASSACAEFRITEAQIESLITGVSGA
jgi:hypothetical protein